MNKRLAVQTNRILESVLDFASRSPVIVSAAIILRDNCRRIIRRSLVSGIRPATNGEELLLKTVAPSASRFVDVGANAGEWSALCISHGTESAAILAFEPSESALARLRDRFGRVQAVEIIPKAVGAQSQFLEFFEEQNAGEMSSLVRGFSRAGAIARQVAVTTVDEELEVRSWDQLDFLKIDTEGFDYNVLSGASKSIAAQRIGVIQFEYNAPWATIGTTLRRAIDFLQGYKYAVYLLKADGLYTFSYSRYGEYFAYSNFVAVSPSYMERVQHLVRGTL